MNKKNKFTNIVEIIRIRFNNVIAFALFNILKVFYYQNKGVNKAANKILFINTGLLGDVIISTVIFENEDYLKNIYKEIYFLVDKKFKEIFAEYYGKINLIYWESEKYRTSLIYRIVFLNKLNKLSLDISYNITFARKIIDDEISILNGAKEKICFRNNPKIVKTFSKYMDSLYDLIITPKYKNHFDNLIDLIKSFGIENPKMTNKLFFNITTPQFNSVITKNNNDKIFSIAPFSSNQLKNWNFIKYTELISLLIKKYDPIIFILGKKKINLEKISSLSSKIINFTGLTTLSEVSYLIYNSELFIGNDSGLFHLAKSYNKNRVGIIGGGAFNIIHPYNNKKKEVLLYKEMKCFQCHWNCEFNIAYCVQDVSVQEVFNSIEKLLNDE